MIVPSSVIQLLSLSLLSIITLVAPAAAYGDYSGDACSLMTMLPFTGIDTKEIKQDDNRHHQQHHDQQQQQQQQQEQQYVAPNKFSTVLASRMAYGFAAAAMMAMEHFNQRNASVVPELADVAADCRFFFARPRFVDTMADGRASVRALWEHLASQNDPPCAILAPISESALIQTVPAVDAFEIPMINYFSETEDLTNATSVANLVLTKQGRLNAVAEYFNDRKYIVIWSDAEPFEQTLGDFSMPGNMEVLTIRNPNMASMDSNVQRMKDSGMKTIYCDISTVAKLADFAVAVNKAGLLDDGTLYILPPEIAKSDDFEILYRDVKEGSPLDKLLSGALVFDRLDGFRSNPSSDAFLAEWRRLDNYAIDRMNELVPDSVKFHAAPDFFQRVDPTNYASFAYDAVMSIGLGACSLQAANDKRIMATTGNVSEDAPVAKGTPTATVAEEIPLDGFLVVTDTPQHDKSLPGPITAQGGFSIAGDENHFDDALAYSSPFVFSAKPDETYPLPCDPPENATDAFGTLLPVMMESWDPTLPDGPTSNDRGNWTNVESGNSTYSLESSNILVYPPAFSSEGNEQPSPPRDQEAGHNVSALPTTPNVTEQYVNWQSGSEEYSGQVSLEQPTLSHGNADDRQNSAENQRFDASQNVSESGQDNTGNNGPKFPVLRPDSGNESKPRPVNRTRRLEETTILVDDINDDGPTTLLQAILAQSFSGASGHLQFENEGNSRVADGIPIGLYNIQRKNSVSLGESLHRSVLVSKYEHGFGWMDVSGTTIFLRNSRAYASPARVFFDENYIGFGVRVIGLVLMVLAWSIGVLGSALLYVFRKDNVIQRAQPFFMQILCWGSILMSTSIFTLSWDEGAGWSDEQLNVACTVTPWFFFVGQIMTFCALFTKLWRVDQVLQFRKRVVTVSNVMKPTLAIMTVAIAILTVWTVMDPWTWKRELIVEVPAETYGQCESRSVMWFFGPLVGLLCFAEALTLYYAWKTADVPEDFRDSGSVMYASFAQLQSFAIGVPMLAVLGHSSAEATYFGRIFLIWIFAVSSVSVVVGPKVIRAIQLRICPDKANQKGRVNVTGVYARQPHDTATTEDSLTFKRVSSRTTEPSREVQKQSSEQSAQESVREGSHQYLEI